MICIVPNSPLPYTPSEAKPSQAGLPGLVAAGFGWRWGIHGHGPPGPTAYFFFISAGPTCYYVRKWPRLAFSAAPASFVFY